MKKTKVLIIFVALILLITISCSQDTNGPSNDELATITYENASSPDNNTKVYSIKEDGSDNKQLIDLDWIDLNSPPRSKKMVFTKYNCDWDFPSYIYTAQDDGSNITELIIDDANYYGKSYAADISHDANLITCVGDPHALILINIDKKNEIVIENVLDYGWSLPSFSPDDNKVAYYRPHEDYKSYLCVFDLNNLVLDTLYNNAFPPHYLFDDRVEWSPDGSRMVFTGFIDNSEICSIEPDGSNFTNLTNDPGEDYMPIFSPDGLKIAYVHEGSIWIMNADGSQKKKCTNQSSEIEIFPQWSKDSQKLLLTTSPGDDWGTITIYNLETQSITYLDVNNSAVLCFWK